MILHLFGCLLFESAQIEVDTDVNDTGDVNDVSIDTSEETGSEIEGNTEDTSVRASALENFFIHFSPKSLSFVFSLLRGYILNE